MLKNGLIASVILLLLAPGGRAAPVSDAELRSSDKDAGNWLMYGRTYDDHRFSPLKQINEQSIAKLGLAWNREMGTTRGLEATPLVKDGVLYTTGSWSVVHAIGIESVAGIRCVKIEIPLAEIYVNVAFPAVERDGAH